MAEWVQMNPEKIRGLARPRKAKPLRGAEVNVYWSPYDIPEAYRGYYDQATGWFRIEFRYIDSDQEDALLHQHDEVTRFAIARNSGRLYAIELDVQTMKVSVISLRTHVRKAVDQLLRETRPRSATRSSEGASKFSRYLFQRQTERPRNNYKAVRETVESQAHSIFAHT